MTELEKAAVLAIDALETWRQSDPNSSAAILRGPALRALRYALASPQPNICDVCKNNSEVIESCNITPTFGL